MKKNKKKTNKIVKFFDKRIVIPITRVILKIVDTFDKSSHHLEKVISNPTILLFISLAMALLIFLFVDQKKLSLVNSSAEVFKNQPVEVLYNEERFVLEGVPENVDITLIGGKADLYIAKQKKNHTVQIDLSNIKEEGTYKVDLTYKVSSNIESSVNPSQATIRAYLKKSENRTLASSIVNSDKLDSALGIDNVKLNIDQAIISGAEYNLEKVATVKALVDIEKLTSKTSGKHILDEIILKAYDSEGNIVDVEINTKEKVTAEISISSSSREVPLNFVIKDGTSMPFGKAIKSYSFSNNTVVAYGSKSVLDELENTGIDIIYDVSKLTTDFKGAVEIPVPSGIKKLSNNEVTLNIQVSNSVSSFDYNMTVKVDVINVPNGYTKSPVSDNDTEVIVKPTCSENVCKALSNADIEAIADFSPYATSGPGVYALDVKIKPKTSNARLAQYIVTPAKVNIKLSKK